MSKLKASHRLNEQVRTEATDWLIRFSEEEVDAAAREDFNRWLRVSPEHVRAYLRISAFWQEADRIGGKSINRDVDALVQLAQREANVFPLELERASPQASLRAHAELKTVEQRQWGSRMRLAVAASLLLTLGIGALTWSILAGAPTYVTGVGEHRTVNLPDGSTVIINSSSRIKVRYTDNERGIDLRQGQALFKVARNPNRPFIVRSGGTSIRAVGTQFDVYKKDGGTVVTVLEGRVAVNSAAAHQPDSRSGESLKEAEKGGRTGEVLLAAGEQALVTPRSALKSQLSRPQTAAAWTEGLLVFDGAPLSEVVREFNRQNVKPLVISGAELSDLKISGTFPANGAERIVRFLEERFHVVTLETDQEIRISRP